MPHPNAFLEKLARSSLRLNKGLMVLGALVLLLLGISYLGVQRMLEEQRDTLQFHFARLMENIHEQEVFLRDISQASAKGQYFPLVVLPTYSQKLLPDEGPNIYEGRGLPFSLPFSVKIDPQRIAADQYPKVFALGIYLSAYYSAFWAGSHYQAPQVVVVNGPDNFDIAVPSSGRLRDGGHVHIGMLVDVMTQLNERLHLQNTSQTLHTVHWEPYDTAPDGKEAPILLGYVDINLASTSLTVTGANTWVVVASLLDLSKVNNIERLMQWSIYDDFTLITPGGVVLTGAVKPGEVLNEGVNFNRDGLVFKLTSQGEQPWTAIYVISLQRFLDYALWPLLCLVGVVLVMLGCSRAFNRWYTARVVLPAHRAHASIAESSAFARAVIDTAPTGLCVIRRSDHHVLLQNQRALEWRDARPLFDLLKQQTHAEPGQADLESEGRHLHVAFVPTRYQGQDAWLCAVHDVTRHIEDAAALEEARQAADSASEAKSRFLATMSHEIRTPLYGVLGTLELLGLTSLAPRQQDYLQTIQRSSTTLFQLISDVLDVSKIEAGQMTLELQDFCPLGLTEDCVRTYSAFARSKGLQLYACIDAGLPDRLRGDPLRIRQILNNLLSNAIKFTDNGRVVLRLRASENTDGEVDLQWQVSDSGVGISQAQQQQLFDPFYQAEDATSQAGAGLGLAICKWLCELMHGQLNVVSEPGLGSSFTLQLTLPVVPGDLADCPVFSAGAPAVYVRAPIAELAQHVTGWLNRLGLDSRLGGLGIGLLVQMADDDVAALAGEQDGDRTADAGIGAGDQGRETLKLARALPEGGVVHRGRVQRGLVAGLGLVLFGEGRRGIGAGAGLDGAGGFIAAGLLVLGVDVALDGAFLVGDVVGAGVEAVVHDGSPEDWGVLQESDPGGEPFPVFSRPGRRWCGWSRPGAAGRRRGARRFRARRPDRRRRPRRCLSPFPQPGSAVSRTVRSPPGPGRGLRAGGV